jgi:hypothetical protein
MFRVDQQFQPRRDFDARRNFLVPHQFDGRQLVAGGFQPPIPPDRGAVRAAIDRFGAGSVRRGNDALADEKTDVARRLPRPPPAPRASRTSLFRHQSLSQQRADQAIASPFDKFCVKRYFRVGGFPSCWQSGTDARAFLALAPGTMARRHVPQTKCSVADS